MATSSDKYTPYYGSRLGPFRAVLRTIEGSFESLLRRRTEIIMLTEAEQSQAGIYLGGERRN